MLHTYAGVVVEGEEVEAVVVVVDHMVLYHPRRSLMLN